MITSTHIRAGSAITIAVILLSAAAPAGAFNQSGQVRSASISMLGAGNCPLERVGTQFVRCDNLTGAGVPAPSWVPELKSSADLSPQSPRHGSTI
jgi:hypothetical protein